MWPKSYKKMPKNGRLKKEQVEPLEGIVGCEMHDRFGYLDDVTPFIKKKKGLLRTLLEELFRKR